MTSALELAGWWQTVQLEGTDVSDASGGIGAPLLVSFSEASWSANDGTYLHSGNCRVTPDGQFSAKAGSVTGDGTLLVPYLRNVEVVLEANQARIRPADNLPVRQLTLLRDGEILATYHEIHGGPDDVS